MLTLSVLHKRRLIITSVLLIGAAIVIGLVLFALQQNINLYYTPAQIANGEAPVGKRIRVGGMVVKDSITRKEGLNLNFMVSDYASSIQITYNGILPTLFGENQGVVALGILGEKHVFFADEILAKHDENYMPKEVAASLKLAAKSTVESTTSGN